VTAIPTDLPVLETGDKLTLDEFLRRWEAMPHVKKAELIEGIVYMPSPLSTDHGDTGSDVAGWLAVYRAHTPGTRASDNATTVIDEENCPQPDHSLRLLPEADGRTGQRGRLLSGAPEFVAEISASSASYDLHLKKDLYERQGVDEYLVVLLFEREIRWHRLEDGSYRNVQPDKDGVWRSTAFPGLWLDGKALLAGDLAKVLRVLQRGLDSPEHAEFVERLKKRMASGKGEMES
jgi:Uma2 family endonuclease